MRNDAIAYPPMLCVSWLVACAALAGDAGDEERGAPGPVPPADEVLARITSCLAARGERLVGKSVWLRLLGPQTRRCRIVAVEKKAITVNARGLSLEVTWDRLGQDGAYSLGMPIAEGEDAGFQTDLLWLGVHLGRAKEPGFQQVLGKLRAQDAAAAGTIEAALRSRATAKATAKAASARVVRPKPPPADHLKARDLAPVNVHDTPKHNPIVLVRDGRPGAIVYVADDSPSRNLEILIGELVESVRLATGAVLPVIRNASRLQAGVPVIAIGDCPASQAAGIDASKIPVEGFVVKTAPKRVFLVGSTMPLPLLEPGGWPSRYGNFGTAWAVADFLERFVGVRWYWPVNVGGRSVPEAKTLEVPPSFYSDKPVFRKREYHPDNGIAKKNWSPLWYDKNAPVPTERAIPAGVDHIDLRTLLAGLRHGFSCPYMIKVHDPQQVWKHQKLVDEHPGMFSMKGNGERNFSMLCYSSQETFDFLIAGCEANWDRNKRHVPAWDNIYTTWVQNNSVTVSPFDQPLSCACDACRSSFKHGGAAGHIQRFVKKMCEEVKRRWPDKKVMFLPYWNYERCQEDIEYPDNLVIQLCTSTMGPPRGPEALSQRLESNIAAWQKKSCEGKIQTWEYTGSTNKTLAPFQFPHALKAYYTRNRDRFVGSFINGGDHLGEWSYYAITHYCWMKILWNPDVDVDAIMDVFCERMFGKAHKIARALLRIQCDRYESSGISPGTGNGRENTGGIRRIYPEKIVAEMEQLWQLARRELKDDPVSLQRFEYFTWTFEHFVRKYGKQRR